MAKYNNASVEQSEKHTALFIPYSHHYNANTIVTKAGDLVSTIKVSGYSFEVSDDEDLEVRKNMRNNLFKGIANSDFALWFHTIRRQHSAYPDGNFDTDFTILLNDQWHKRHRGENVFINEHYVTLIHKAQGKLSGIDWMRIIGGKTNDNYNAMMEMYNTFDEARDRMLNGLNPYKARLLGTKQTKYGTQSELLRFLSTIINGGRLQDVGMTTGNLDTYLPNTRLFFDYDVMHISGMNYKKYAGIVSIKEYRPATYAGMMDSFLQLPYQFIISQSFSFSDRMSAISTMQLQQRRLIQSEDVAVSQIQEINEALDSAMSGEFAFGKHHLTVMCIHDNEKGLDNALSQITVAFSNIGVSAVRENINMEPCFWSQLPTNFDFLVRHSTINTINLAGYASLHNYPSGKNNGNFWGDAVTVFNTTSGTPYFFSFHTRDVGHTMIIGPTGAGKTVLMNFLVAQAQKFHPRCFFFDKDHGAEIFMRAIGGKYSAISPGKSSGFNPLQLDDTPENRHFLLELLSALLTTNNEILSADDISVINTAIDGNYRIAKVDRRLSNIASFFGLETPGSLAGRLRMWHSGGTKSSIFDNLTDNIDFLASKLFCFEMGEILKDKAALPAVLLYLFHRINMALDGTPTMIILDEAWALIDNHVFAPKIKDWLKVLRKLNAFVVFATQSVEDASKSQISDTLVQQTATQIFLPNLKATNAYRDVFMLSEREFALVKNTDPSTRFFLIKQDQDGVIARIDLSGMTDCVNILSGRTETVILLDQIRKEYGDDHRQWLYPFLEKAREV